MCTYKIYVYVWYISIDIYIMCVYRYVFICVYAQHNNNYIICVYVYDLPSTFDITVLLFCICV